MTQNSNNLKASLSTTQARLTKRRKHVETPLADTSVKYTHTAHDLTQLAKKLCIPQTLRPGDPTIWSFTPSQLERFVATLLGEVREPPRPARISSPFNFD